MEFRTLGNSGAVVSSYALGTVTFGAEATEQASHAILDSYAAAGGDFIDTADVYSAGVSEEIIGRWLAQRPEAKDRMVLATKGRFPLASPGFLGISTEA
jgi:aryl-alcohol dehydrogenase-like predicted oxidoreductase